jgi:hypothetical protein
MADILMVLPNPAAATDENGEPCAAVQFENSSGSMWVGAQIDFARSKAEGRTRFTFDTTRPVQVPCTAYYMRKLIDGDLLPADEATAKRAGLKLPATAQLPKTAAATKKKTDDA